MPHICVTVKPVLRDYWHERPPVLKDPICLAEEPTFQYNWTCHRGQPVFRHHTSVANGVVFQDMYSTVLISTSPKFRSIPPYDQPISRYRQLWDKCTEWPQNDLEHYKVKCTQYICITSISESQIPLRFALRTAVTEIHAIWDKCTEWPQNSLAQYKVKDSLYMC